MSQISETTKGKVHLIDREDGFVALGMDPVNPADWEDALRLKKPFGQADYEWWYTDAHFANGDFCVVSYHFTMSPGGKMVPAVMLNLARKGEKVCDQRVTFDLERFKSSETKCDVSIGKSFIRSEDGLNRYRIYVDPDENNGYGVDLEFVRTAPSYRPATGRWSDGENHFSWFCAMPGADVNGTLTFQGEIVKVSGNGYHDHNWGDISIEHFIDHWLWGRAHVDGISVVASAVRFKEEVGGIETPLLFVGRNNEILIDALNKEVVCLDGHKVPHQITGKKISSNCIYIVEHEGENSQIRFKGQGSPIAYFVRPQASGKWETAYARFAAIISIDIASNEKHVHTSGIGTLEHMDLLGRKIA